MNELIHTYRSHVLNLCYGVVDACSLTDISVLKTQAQLVLNDLGVEKPEPKQKPKEEDWRDLL